MAGIWLSVILGGLLLLLTFAVLVSNMTKSVDIEQHSILRISLTGEIVDRDAPIPFIDAIQGEGNELLSLSKIVNSIKAAANDPRIDGIYLDCGGASAGLAQSQAIIDALRTFRQSKKFVWAYSDDFTQGNYFIATAADSIFLNPVGMVDIHGLSASTFYLRDLLDKIGVDVQVVKVGTYKSAVEPFLLTQMSEANREQQEHFLGRIWSAMSKKIAANRGLKPDSIDSFANRFAFSLPAEEYVKAGLVDNLLYRRQIEERLAKATQRDEPKFVDADDYASQIDAVLDTEPEKKIAVLYAVGDITEDDNDGIASERLVPQILELAENKEISGLILRINSGGGSAFASEQIWEALEQYKAKTKHPFYVSMGDMAASGGYYIACGANKIYAEPLTLTGSIGIFGMIPNFQPLLNDKLGVNVGTVETNTGGLPDFFSPMTEPQRQAMQTYVDRGYDLFTSRCAAGRHMPIKKILEVAEGRVWDGQSALELGLVDKLGGLDLAIADMANAIGVKPDKLGIVEYPEITLNWWQTLPDIDDPAMKMVSDVFAASGISAKSLGKLSAYTMRLLKAHPIQCRTSPIIIK